MDKQQILLFNNLKRITDYWVETATNYLTPEADLRCSDVEKDIRDLQKVLNTPQLQAAFSNVVNDIITGVMHSMMVMVDGGDTLADEMKIDIINVEMQESIKGKTALHEEFIGYLIEAKEES